MHRLGCCSDVIGLHCVVFRPSSSLLLLCGSRSSLTHSHCQPRCCHVLPVSPQPAHFILHDVGEVPQVGPDCVRCGQPRAHRRCVVLSCIWPPPPAPLSARSVACGRMQWRGVTPPLWPCCRPQIPCAILTRGLGLSARVPTVHDRIVSFIIITHSSHTLLKLVDLPPQVVYHT